MELSLQWSDVFDINPAVSADRGLALGAEIFPRLQRLQPDLRSGPTAERDLTRRPSRPGTCDSSASLE